METISIDKNAENVYQKLVSDPFSILINNPKQPLHARNSFRKRYFERGLSKSLEKLKFIFLSNPVPFKEQKLSKIKGAWNY